MTKRIAKKPYKRPTLTKYGAFAQLTAGGSGTLGEGMMMTAMMRRA